jgi:hypothetical protein
MPTLRTAGFARAAALSRELDGRLQRHQWPQWQIVSPSPDRSSLRPQRAQSGGAIRARKSSARMRLAQKTM